MVQVQAFLALAEELHFGRAAQRLRVSQPRVSRLIATVEREAGAPLFERTSRRVALTPLGAQFRDELGSAYAQMQAALDHAHRAAREAAGQIRVGCAVTVGGCMIVHEAEIDWDQPGRFPYDRTHAEL